MVPGRRSSPLVIVLAVLVAGAAWGTVSDAVTEGLPVRACDPATCEEGPLPAVRAASAPSSTLDATSTCANAGYLCAELQQEERYRVQRWRNFEGTMVVAVPRPDFEDPAVAVELQRAAVAGVRAWNNQPFPIVVDTRGDRAAHVTVRWRASLPGTQIGLARTRWSPPTGMSRVTIELTTRDPYAPESLADPRRVRLTAAHEMGHALGLPHSDSERDVMYPTNTATSVTARDRRTMEVLYEVADGAEITP